MAGRQGHGCRPRYTGARGCGARAPQLQTQGGLGGTNFHGPMEPVLHDKEHASSCKYQPSFSFTKHGMLDIQAQCTSCIQPLQPCKLLIKEFAKHATGNCGAWGTCASRNFWLQTVTKRQTVFTGHFWKQAIKHNSLANSKLIACAKIGLNPKASSEPRTSTKPKTDDSLKHSSFFNRWANQISSWTAQCTLCQCTLLPKMCATPTTNNKPPATKPQSPL